jgi:hypothetical protein
MEGMERFWIREEETISIEVVTALSDRCIQLEEENERLKQQLGIMGNHMERAETKLEWSEKLLEEQKKLRDQERNDAADTIKRLIEKGNDCIEKAKEHGNAELQMKEEEISKLREELKVKEMDLCRANSVALTASKINEELGALRAQLKINDKTIENYAKRFRKLYEIVAI